jgi:hypothetical protein
MIYYCGFLQLPTKSAPEPRPTWHRLDNSPSLFGPVGEHDAHCEHPVLPIDRGTERFPQILRMMSPKMVNCPPLLLERIRACVSSPAPVLPELPNVAAFAQHWVALPKLQGWNVPGDEFRLFVETDEAPVLERGPAPTYRLMRNQWFEHHFEEPRLVQLSGIEKTVHIVKF